MKWILLIAVITWQQGDRVVREYEVKGWSSRATCEEAERELKRKYSSGLQEVKAYCTQDPEAFELPRPR